MFDFPNTPTSGDQTTTPNGTIFTWDGTKWVGGGQALVAARDSARLQAQWQNAAIVSDDTVWLCYDTPYPGTVNPLTYFTGTGSFTVNVQINGVSVTGLSAVVVSSSTPATAAPSGANSFPEHARITAVITGSTGSPTDALLSLAVTWS